LNNNALAFYFRDFTKVNEASAIVQTICVQRLGSTSLHSHDEGVLGGVCWKAAIFWWYHKATKGNEQRRV